MSVEIIDIPAAGLDRLAEVTGALAAHAEHNDRTADFPAAGIRVVHRAGLLTATVARRYGGPAAGLADTARILGALGRGGPGGPGRVGHRSGADQRAAGRARARHAGPRRPAQDRRPRRRRRRGLAGIDDIIEQLNRQLVGLAPVKKRVKEIAALLLVDQAPSAR